jgi:hypothetical protein
VRRIAKCGLDRTQRRRASCRDGQAHAGKQHTTAHGHDGKGLGHSEHQWRRPAIGATWPNDSSSGEATTGAWLAAILIALIVYAAV